jgi:hypothetical protein
VPRAELDIAVDEMVAKLKQTMPECFRYAQQQANFWKDLAWNETVGHTRDWLTIHSRAAETQEGFRAFVEKRPIDYAGLRAGTIPASPPTAETQTCPHCSAGDLPQGFAYCGYCGQSIQEVAKGT